MQGLIYALLAAFCNSCIGIFSSILIDQGLKSREIAFLRCSVALLFTFTLSIFNKNIRKTLKIGKIEIIKYAVLAFFGINVMYLFETTAVQYIPVSLVSFLLYASGIITIILSCIFLNEHLSISKFIAIIAVFLGMGIMFISNINLNGNILGIIYAIIAGAGYALYIFLTKKWSIQSGIKTLLYIFLFGTIFLGIQLKNSNSQMILKSNSFPFIILLAIVPTIGGFYFTNKAINHALASEVQLVEMSEPFIATILGYLILNQVVSKTDLFGGILITIGLIVLEKDCIIDIIKSKKNR